jgi:DNA-binding NarL/FixJ family response regulator
MNETKPIGILIADDIKLLRDVIRLYLERAMDMQVIDEASDLQDALKSFRRLRPDAIIMNSDLPPIDSAYAASLFREEGFTGAILVIAMHTDYGLINRSFRSGVNGVMHKDEIDEYLVEAIRGVHEGERYLSPRAQTAYDGFSE